MCGIAALFNPDISIEAQKIFFKLWTHQESRGRDASGIFAVTADGRVLYAKAPVRASEFVPTIKEYVERHGLRFMYAIAHARDSTRGTPLVNRNNHPIVRTVNGDIYAIVHNGTVDVSVCAEKYTSTDTEELLCAYISSGVEGLYKLARDNLIDSTMAIMRLNRDNGSLVDFIVAKFGIKPLYYSKLSDGVMLFASDYDSKDKDSLPAMKPFKRSIVSLISGKSVDADWVKATCYCYSYNYSYLGTLQSVLQTSHQSHQSQQLPEKIETDRYTLIFSNSYYYKRATCIAKDEASLAECKNEAGKYGCNCYSYV